MFGILNLLFSAAVVLFNDRFRIDLILMEALRQLTTTAFTKSRWAGYLMEMTVFLRLLLWDGASQLLIYFRERLPSRALRGGFFLTASGLQMFIWAKLYSLGYEGHIQGCKVKSSLYSVDAVRCYSDAKLCDILAAYCAAMPESWHYPDAEEYFGALLHDENTIHILLRRDQRPIGYLLAIRKQGEHVQHRSTLFNRHRLECGCILCIWAG